MKKLTSLLVLVMIMFMFDMTHIAEARKGQTSSVSEEITQSGQKASPEKSSKRTKSSSFTDAAKTKKAKTAWQDYLKKQEPPPPSSSPMPPPVSSEKTPSSLEQQLGEIKDRIKQEKKAKKKDKLSKQLADIEKQIAETKRQQQLIAIAQTAAQALLNKQRQPQPPVANTNLAKTAQPNLPTAPAKEAASKSGSSWGWLLWIIGGVTVIWLWRRKTGSNTVYRI